MSGLSRTPGKRVYGESRNEGSNPSLSANTKTSNPLKRLWGCLKPRTTRGFALKAPDCGSGTRPKKPSQTPFVSKPPDFFGFSSEL